MLISQPETLKHENVLHLREKKSGLNAIIAVHQLHAGIAMGGTRLFPYASEEEALADALRLSESMTYKAAGAGIPVGGAKAVIIADPRNKNEELLRAYARFVDSLRGAFITGQDLNINADDVQIMAQETSYMVGCKSTIGSAAMTARGIFEGLKAALRVRLKAASFRNIKVAIQGVGEVGGRLAELLSAAGADVIISDVNLETANRVATRLGLPVVSNEHIYMQDVDIFAPCGRGGIINPETIPMLKASIIGGAANNQLLNEERDGNLLKQHGIAYCPDFIINAGGLIEVYSEYDNAQPETTNAMIQAVGKTIETILTEASEKNLSAHVVALDLARRRCVEFAGAKAAINPEVYPRSSKATFFE